MFHLFIWYSGVVWETSMMLTMRYLLSKHSNLKVKNCCFEIKHNGDDSYDNRKTKRYSFLLIKMRQAFSRAPIDVGFIVLLLLAVSAIHPKGADIPLLP